CNERICSMVRYLLLVVGLSLFQGTARADEQEPLVGVSPCLILVHEVDRASGSLVFRQAETNTAVIEKEVAQTSANGKIENRKIPVYQEVRDLPRHVKLRLKDIKVYDMAGTLLDEAAIWKRVKPGTEVVIARWGDKIGLDYLFVLKKET